MFEFGDAIEVFEQLFEGIENLSELIVCLGESCGLVGEVGIECGFGPSSGIGEQFSGDVQGVWYERLPERLRSEESGDGIDRPSEFPEVGTGFANHVVVGEGCLLFECDEYEFAVIFECRASLQAVVSGKFDPGPNFLLSCDDLSEVGWLCVGVDEQDTWSRECFVGCGSPPRVGDSDPVGQSIAGFEWELREIDGEVFDDVSSAEPLRVDLQSFAGIGIDLEQEFERGESEVVVGFGSDGD